MTEAMSTTTPERAAQRCQVGSQTDHRCWRDATERVWEEDPYHLVCAEHHRAIELRREADELLYTLDEMGKWIATWDDPEEDEGPLKRFAFKMRQKAVSELWQATVRAEAAERIAERGQTTRP